MTGAVVFVGLMLAFGAMGVWALCANVDRVAKAMEAQNTHYGIGQAAEEDEAA